MKKPTTLTAVVPAANIEEAWQEVGASFERFCLTAGLATLSSMMEEDAVQLCGPWASAPPIARWSPGRSWPWPPLLACSSTRWPPEARAR